LNAASDPDTEELLSRARAGDAAAVEQLLVRHRDRLAQMVAVRMDDRLGARVDPSDVVQETLAIAARRLPEYLRNSSLAFYPWLRQIAWTRLVDLHRCHVAASKRSVSREEPMGLPDSSTMQLANWLATGGTGPLRHLLREELRERVRSAMAQLGTEDREILLLRHLEELSYAECAVILGTSEAAAMQRHVRAARRLHRLLGPAISEEV
jgi:RNA polymerase sigma-70 factor (ECF subfamily)